MVKIQVSDTVAGKYYKMTTGNESFGLEDMVKILKIRKRGNQHTTLVLGSRASHLFHSDYLYETMKIYGDPSFNNLSQPLRFADCYHLLVRPIPGFSRSFIDSILTKSLKDTIFIEADFCLAELVKSGIFDIIITSIMDNMLEQAFENAGLKELRDFEVFSLHPGIEREKLFFNKNVRCHVIKVFGELTSRDYTVKRAGYFNQHMDIRQHLEIYLSGDLLIIGLDPVWDDEMYHIFPTEGGSIWFLNEEQLNEDSNLFHAGKARNAQYLLGDAYEYRQFLPDLYEQYFGSSLDGKFDSGYPGIGIILRELRHLTYEVKDLREQFQDRFPKL